MSVGRYRERHSTSGAKSDAGDAHVLAEIVRLDRSHHRPVAGDFELSEAITLVARGHQSLVWDRTRHVLPLRGVLREFFPAAMEAFADLDAPDALELLAAAQIQSVLRAPALRQPAQVQAACAAIVTTQVRLIGTRNGEIAKLGEVVAGHLGRHREAEIYTSQPRLGVILAANPGRVQR